MNNTTEINKNEVQEVYDTFNGIGMVMDLVIVKGVVIAGLVLAKCFGIM